MSSLPIPSAVLLGGLAVLLAACSSGGSSGAEPGGGAIDGFALTIDPPALQIAAGSSVQVTVRVTPQADFDAEVLLEVGALPTGVSAVLDRSTVAASGDVALDLSAAPGTDAASHRLTITGRSGALERSATLDLGVVDSGFDFGLDADLRSLAVSQGGTTSTTIRLIPRMGSLPTASLSVQDLPAGWTATFASGGSTADSDTLTLAPDASVTPGSHELTVAATADGLQRTVSLLAHVLPPSESSGLTIAAPCVLQVRRGASTAAQIDIMRDLGVVGDVAVQVDGVPADVGVLLDENPVRGAVALLTCSAGSTAPLGEHLLTLTATWQASRGTAHFLLQVVDDLPIADVRIQRVELAQSFFAPEPVLVGGKTALLRAHVVADLPNVAAPTVRVEAARNGTPLGTLDLAGPTTLPLGEAPASLPQSFVAELPATWVGSGLELALTVDPDGETTDREERNDRVLVHPAVGAENHIDLVVVPLRLAGREAQAGTYYDELLAQWPLTDISISVRAPYTVSSVTEVSSDGTGWIEVLAEVSSLRSADQSSAYYYGVVPVSYGGGVAGMGYIGFPVSIGWHRTTDVLVHEIGHNFGLHHAPCNVSSFDPSYPFSGALIGHWGYDRRSGALVDPRITVDLMSYCGPDWISGYNHEKVRARLGGPAALVERAGGGEIPLLMVRGRIARGEVVQVDGVTRLYGEAIAVTRGDLLLRLRFGGGRTADHPVATSAVGCGTDPDQRHFVAVIPDPGELEGLELLRGERRLWSQRSRRPPTPLGVAFADAGLQLDLEERAGMLRLRWDAVVWPSVGIVHVGSGRTTLALKLQGGDASVSLAGVPAGGSFEIAVADGIDGFAVRVPR